MGTGLTVGSAVGSVVPVIGTFIGGTIGGIFDGISSLFGGGNEEQHYLDLLSFARSQARSEANRTPPSIIPDSELVAWAQMIHTQKIENPLRQEILEALKQKYRVQTVSTGGLNVAGLSLGGLSLTNPVVLFGAGALIFLLTKK